jgi:hypothetical protein
MPVTVGITPFAIVPMPAVMSVPETIVFSIMPVIAAVMTPFTLLFVVARPAVVVEFGRWIRVWQPVSYAAFEVKSETAGSDHEAEKIVGVSRAAHHGKKNGNAEYLFHLSLLSFPV